MSAYEIYLAICLAIVSGSVGHIIGYGRASRYETAQWTAFLDEQRRERGGAA